MSLQDPFVTTVLLNLRNSGHWYQCELTRISEQLANKNCLCAHSDLRFWHKPGFLSRCKSFSRAAHHLHRCSLIEAQWPLPHQRRRWRETIWVFSHAN